MKLVLSIFPGLGLLDRAFEAEGFCVVRGPDVIWGGDVRSFHPPRGVFDGVIGGDPCQSHSRLSNLVRAKGLEPSFPDMTPEFERIVREAQPRWFLRENVPQAPGLKLDAYWADCFLLDNASLLDPETGRGQEQTRTRRFWFGRYVDNGPCFDCSKPRGATRHCADCAEERARWDWPHLREFIDFAAFELPDAPAVCGDAPRVPVALGGSGKVKRTACGSGHDSSPSGIPRAKRGAVTARHPGEIGLTGGHRGSPGRYSIADMLHLQGLPADAFEHCPFTAEGLRKGIGNGVPQAMGRALARAVRQALA